MDNHIEDGQPSILKGQEVALEEKAAGSGAGWLPETAAPAETTSVASDARQVEEASSTDGEKLSLLMRKMDEWTDSMERLQFSEYVRYVNDKKRIFRSNFWAGMIRGMGMAVGFTILGAVVVLFLQDLAKQNLPLIGDALARVLEIVQVNMNIK